MKGVPLLIFTQLWESFSFYGMRVLLALYLITELHYSDHSAFALYALYIALVEIGAGVGGYCADKFLGYRGAVLLGGAFIAVGHLLLTFSHYPPLFFMGLGSIICGATLFRANLKALLGLQYEQNDPKQESGFTLLYVGINVGGFAAALLCGLAASLYGWHVGFGLAAVGMLIGMTIFFFNSKKIDSKPMPVVIPTLLGTLACLVFAYLLSQFAIAQAVILPLAIVSMIIMIAILAQKMTLSSVMAVSGVLLLLIAYFSVEELMGSLLMVFSETHVDRYLLGFQVPSTILNAINPLAVMIGGPLLSRFNLSTLTRLSTAFILLGIAFTTLFAASLIPSPSIFYIVISFSAIALGEIFLAPTIFAFCSKAAPTGAAGLMMGLVTLAFSIASLLSGQTSQLSYSLPSLFLAISLGASLIGLSLFLSSKLRNRKIAQIGRREAL